MEYKLQQVRCADLKVDESYQRELIPEWVNKIISQWDEQQVRPLTISRRSNGDMMILDGRHTTYAALSIYGDKAKLPAKIYDGLTRKEEAELFEKLNSNSRKVTFNDKLKALFSAGDKDANDYIHCLCDSGVNWKFTGGGRSNAYVSHKGGMNLFHIYGAETFTSAMRVLALVSDAEMLNVGVAGGVCYLLGTDSLDKREIITVLRKHPYDDIKKQTRRYGSDNRHGGAEDRRIWALAILDFYNKGKTKRQERRLNDEYAV